MDGGSWRGWDDEARAQGHTWAEFEMLALNWTRNIMINSNTAYDRNRCSIQNTIDFIIIQIHLCMY